MTLRMSPLHAILASSKPLPEAGRIGERVDKTPRQPGVDTARYGMAFLVVLLHALAMGRPPSVGTALILNLCHAAVPFFFIAAGYFLPPDPAKGLSKLPKQLARLITIHLSWTAIYILFFQTIFPYDLSFQIRSLLFGGAAFHLWFLPALGAALTFVVLGRAWVGSRLTGAACFALGIVSIANGAYHDVLGLPGEGSRGGLLVAPMFVYSGTLISKFSIRHGWQSCVGFVAVAYAVLVGEEALITWLSGSGVLGSHDFVFSTLMYGAAVFMLARALPETETIRKFAFLGGLSLNIYLVHILFLWPLLKFYDVSQLWMTLLIAAVTFGLSTAFSVLLVRIPFLRYFST
ncbi:acyltransferase family protein [Paeniroseomonas aquatica]|uniref:Acyltransferase family protein n=2 Tax=Paeniroseomonas aquatica TaxID=373043 RepID=A0ABT8A2E7_9PROT|nr:acyltransferase family protein [Paeniroseomonas aquatica]MDN3563933.1 acyltransferase family protein [Paeniroseomonas aquatica]